MIQSLLRAMELLELLKEANKAREKSYSPYSHFSVGACILCKDGRFFHAERSPYALIYRDVRPAPLLQLVCLHSPPNRRFLLTPLRGGLPVAVSQNNTCILRLFASFPISRPRLKAASFNGFSSGRFAPSFLNAVCSTLSAGKRSE